MKYSTKNPKEQKFWALFGMLSKFNFADRIFHKLDRAGTEIVAPEYWNWNGVDTPKLTEIYFWAAILKSIFEGLTDSLDDFQSGNFKTRKQRVQKVFGDITQEKWFMSLDKNTQDLVKNLKSSRNLTYHCNWDPFLHYKVLNKQKDINGLEKFHNALKEYLWSETENIYIDLIENDEDFRKENNDCTFAMFLIRDHQKTTELFNKKLLINRI